MYGLHINAEEGKSLRKKENGETKAGKKAKADPLGFLRTMGGERFLIDLISSEGGKRTCSPLYPQRSLYYERGRPLKDRYK